MRLRKAYQRAIQAIPLCVVAIAPALAACDSASVSVKFDVPDEYRAQIRTVVLRVLVPPEDGEGEPAYGCDAIALRRVSQSDLLLGQVQEVVAAPGGVRLSGIPRLGPKLFWLEARDSQNLPITAGCAPLGDIEGEAVVDVPAEPAKVVVFQNFVDIEFVSVGQPLPDQVSLTVTDTNGAPLAGTPVEWQVVGMAARVYAAGSETSEDNGRTVIGLNRSVDPRTIPGPALLDVAVRWPRTPLPNIGGFGALDLLMGPTDVSPTPDTSDAATDNLYAVGRIGPAGEMGFAALGPTQTASPSRRLVHAWYWDETADPGPFRSVQSDTELVGADHIATITRGGREIAMVATPGALVELEITASGITGTDHAALGDAPQGMVRAGPCQGDSEHLLVLLRRATPPNLYFKVVDATGQEVAGTPFTSTEIGAGRIVGSGCVSGLAGDLTRTVVYGRRLDQGSSENPFIQSVIADTGGKRESLWINFAQSPGFTPALGEHPAALLGTEVGIEGAELVRYSLAPLGAQELELEPIGVDPLFTFASATQGGDFDGDGLVDVAALVELGADRDERQHRIQLVLGATLEDKRIVGLSDGFAVAEPHMFVADFDGDGADDILLADHNQFVVIGGVSR